MPCIHGRRHWVQDLICHNRLDSSERAHKHFKKITEKGHGNWQKRRDQIIMTTSQKPVVQLESSVGLLISIFFPFKKDLMYIHLYKKIKIKTNCNTI